MKLRRVLAAALSPLIVGAGAIGAAPSATADDSGGLLWPDPNEPYYWDANENAGGTGIAPLPTDDLYWKEGEDAGGTGNAPQPDVPEYTNQGENAGAV